jgi:hypothetical protein
LGKETDTDQRASTVSLWKDLPSVFSFVYAGLHLEAFRRRTQWFMKPEWPTYAIWWVNDDHVPQWQEACQKLEQLHDEGASPSVFDFKNPFDEHGNRVDIHAYRKSNAQQPAIAAPQEIVTARTSS